MTDLPFSSRFEYLWEVLQSPPQAFPAYKQRVKKLCSDLSRSFSQQFQSHGADYSSDWIDLFIDQEGSIRSIPLRESCWCKIFVCTRGNVVAIYPQSRRRNGLWEQVATFDLPTKVRQVFGKLCGVLGDFGYRVVPEEEFSALVDGQVTALDGNPANVFQVFFSEVV